MQSLSTDSAFRRRLPWPLASVLVGILLSLGLSGFIGSMQSSDTAFAAPSGDQTTVSTLATTGSDQTQATVADVSQAPTSSAKVVDEAPGQIGHVALVSNGKVTVQPGDTTSEIVRDNHWNYNGFLDANPKVKANPAFIKVGWVLNAPGTAPPTPAANAQPAPVPNAKPASAQYPDGYIPARRAMWDRVALAETQMNGKIRWNCNTGNNHYGGLQFLQTSWVLAGGLQYADRADHATPEEQIAVAEKLLKIQGRGAWQTRDKAGLTEVA